MDNSSGKVMRASVLYAQGVAKLTDGDSVISASVIAPEEEAAALSAAPTSTPIPFVQSQNINNPDDDDANNGDDRVEETTLVQMRKHSHPSKQLSGARDSILVYKGEAAAAVKATNRQTILNFKDEEDVGNTSSFADVDVDSHPPLSAYAPTSVTAVTHLPIQLAAELGSGDETIPGLYTDIILCNMFSFYVPFFIHRFFLDKYMISEGEVRDSEMERFAQKITTK